MLATHLLSVYHHNILSDILKRSSDVEGSGAGGSFLFWRRANATSLVET